MDCDQNMGSNGRDFFERFNKKVNQSRIPVSGCIELTARCNLNCVHCYLGNSLNNGVKRETELSTRQWIDLIDQITDAGCLFLLFTGGEVMLRTDFAEIYRHACKKGLMVNVFTNGTRITDPVMDIFAEYPPRFIEISLYGATAETYEKITGVAGSFEKCMQGIQQFVENGFQLKLKTMLLDLNMHELEEMEAFADNLGVPFRFDAMISARLDEDQAPLKYRVSPAQAVAKEFSNPKRVKDLHDYFYRINSQKLSSDLYICGAGINMFYIDAFGKMRPCLMVTSAEQDLINSCFEKVWKSDRFRQFRGKQKTPVICQGCDKKMLCGYCPGFFKLESGSELVYSEYLCALARERKQSILNLDLEVKGNE